MTMLLFVYLHALLGQHTWGRTASSGETTKEATQVSTGGIWSSPNWAALAIFPMACAMEVGCKQVATALKADWNSLMKTSHLEMRVDVSAEKCQKYALTPIAGCIGCKPCCARAEQIAAIKQWNPLMYSLLLHLRMHWNEHLRGTCKRTRNLAVH